MASQTLISTKKDVVDLGIGQIELAGLAAADKRQPDASSFRDRAGHLFLSAFEDDLFHAAALTRSSGLEFLVKRIRDIDGGPHETHTTIIMAGSAPTVIARPSQRPK